MYPAKDVAIYIINWCHSHNIPITNLKLQKLLYFIQGENCRIRHNRLIKDDFYAWQLGPVVPEVYTEYAIFSSATIPNTESSAEFSEETMRIMDQVLLRYATKSTWHLVDLSHSQGPWKYNYQTFGDKAIIPYKSIESYYGGENI